MVLGILSILPLSCEFNISASIDSLHLADRAHL